jgi:hypothetical protein
MRPGINKTLLITAFVGLGALSAPAFGMNAPGGNGGGNGHQGAGAGQGAAQPAPAAQQGSVLTSGQKAVLRTWVTENILDPNPTDEERQTLADATGLTVASIDNWMENYRTRFWVHHLERLVAAGLIQQ